MKTEPHNHSALTRFAWLSLAAGLFTIVLKTTAYFLTDSVGLLSDALESLVNIAGALMALAMLSIAARPADEEHAFGHDKAEYFSSGVEGIMILVAALGIAAAAIHRLVMPRTLQQIGIGLIVSGTAAAVNLAVAMIILRAGKRHNSITLEANARHLLTDVWTSAGVIAGIGAVAFTGWQRLDPIIALLVAANIVRTGTRIMRKSISGLMDGAIPAAEQEKIRAILNRHMRSGVQYHALRTRQAGARSFMTLHVLVPGNWTVQKGHKLTERIEKDLREAAPNLTAFIHLESINDPASWDDTTVG